MQDILIRSEHTGDKVYIIQDGKRCWVKNPETLFKLGYKFEDVKMATNQEMAAFELGEPVDLSDHKEEVVTPGPSSVSYNNHPVLNYRRSA